MQTKTNSIVDSLFGTTRKRILNQQRQDKQDAREEIKLKKKALDVFSKEVGGMQFLDDRINLATELGLSDEVNQLTKKYNLQTAKSEKEIILDMRTEDDWREVVRGYQTIKNNPGSFYLDNIDAIANKSMERFYNLDFINKLKVEKETKEAEKQSVKQLLDTTSSNIESIKNAVLTGQDPEEEEDQIKEEMSNLKRHSQRLLLIESELNNLDAQIKNPLQVGLNIFNKEQTVKRLKEEKKLGMSRSKMDDVFETDPGPVVKFSKELKSEDDLIQEIIDLEIGQDDVYESDPDKVIDKYRTEADIDEDVQPFASRTEEGNIQLTLPTWDQIQKPFNQNRINYLTRTINSDSATEQMKERARQQLIKLQEKM